jgi:hypothetical protein
MTAIEQLVVPSHLIDDAPNRVPELSASLPTDSVPYLALTAYSS